MTTFSVEQQAAMLRPAAGSAANLHKWLLASAAMGVIAAVVLWHPIPLMVAAFLGIVGSSEQRAGPNILAAIAAYDSGTASVGETSIAVTSWSDTYTYRAAVRERGYPDWEYECIPQGWQPEGGTCPARIWRTGSQDKPVLVVVEAGILIPRYDPKQVGNANQSSPA